jgi:hypothetical protein
MLSHLSRFATLRTLAGAACLAATGAAGALAARDPLPGPAPAVTKPAPPAPAATKPVAVSDMTLARSILTAIDADPTLKDVNLIVSVVDRVAVIGGPVASEEVRKRAEAVVRAVPGVEAVKNVCFVQADPDSLMRAVADRMKPGAQATGSVALPGVALPPAAPDNFLPPVPQQPPSDLIARVPAPKSVEALRPTLPAGPAVNVLGGPVAAPGSGAVVKVTPLPTVAPSVPAPSAVLPLPTTPGALTAVPATGKPTDIQTAAAALRKSNPRFARLGVETKPDGGLFITGWSAKPADAWAFAAELRKVPGVVRVAVDPQLVK